jgi:hypothetical protein
MPRPIGSAEVQSPSTVMLATGADGTADALDIGMTATLRQCL